ncbi:MAG TPA: hypothetical protein VNF27_05505 [Candidatus Binataceae bacterium]|nr:hypothetical protein [Candidatus Binataceae bacterium]
MTQREFDSRVKGGRDAGRARARTPHGRVLSSRLLEAVLFLFCAAFAIELIAHGGRFNPTRPSAAPEATALAAFGAAPMHAARGVVKSSNGASPVVLSAGSGVEGFFAQAWHGAILRMRGVFDPSAASGLRAIAQDLIDQVAAAERAIAARMDSLFPSNSDAGAGAMGLNSNLPMLAGIGAFAALIALCFGAAVFITTRITRGVRARGLRYGSRRF